LPEREEEATGSLNETLALVVNIATRRRWWALGTACGVALATIAVSWFLPNRYTSTATLIVVRQQVPQRYVTPNDTSDLSSALQAMKQEVLSRPRLLKMINDFGLYPKQRKHLAPEQLIALMLSNIDIVPIIEDPLSPIPRRDFDAFKISFITENALLAQQITNTLTSLFTSEYLRSRSEQATNTTEFLNEQLDAKRKKLEEQEERLRDFRLQHVGELPEQQQGNLGILTGLQGQLSNTQASLNRAQQQRAYQQSLLEAYRQRETPATVTTPTGQVIAVPAVNRGAGPIEAAQNDLALLEAAKAALLSKGYKTEHPDMVKIQREIAAKQETLKALMSAAGSTQAANDPAAIPRPATQAAPPAAGPEDTAVVQVRSQLEANKLEIENLSREETRLKASIGQYESRINQTPIREQQESGIKRDTEVLRTEYAEMLKKVQESQLATNLEKEQGGQSFRLIEPANLPTVPTSPKRSKISLGGLGGGLGLGLALALFLEARDTSFRTEKDITKCLALPFVLGIPALPTPREQRRRKVRGAVEWVAASALLLIVAAAQLFIFRHG